MGAKTASSINGLVYPHVEEGNWPLPYSIYTKQFRIIKSFNVRPETKLREENRDKKLLGICLNNTFLYIIIKAQQQMYKQTDEITSN